jgi:hypothetical protein
MSVYGEKQTIIQIISPAKTEVMTAPAPPLSTASDTYGWLCEEFALARETLSLPAHHPLKKPVTLLQITCPS